MSNAANNIATFHLAACVLPQCIWVALGKERTTLDVTAFLATAFWHASFSSSSAVLLTR